jgi:hypothetical protein
MSEMIVKFRDTPEASDSRVSTRVRFIADVNGEFVDEWQRDFRLSAGDSHAIEVNAGHYSVEAFWRNGRSASYSCFVPQDGSGNVVLVSPSYTRVPRSPERDFSRPSAGGMSRRGKGAPPAFEVFVSDDNTDSWSFLCDRDRLSHQSNLSTSTLPAPRDVNFTLSPRDAKERNWVKYWADDEWTVSSLPFDDYQEESCILRSAPEGVPFIASSDPDIASMVDLLPAGNSEAMRRYAAVSFGECSPAAIETMISSRPLGLCAFAYAEYDNFDNANWIGLLPHMKRHAGWLPDISVILGWRCLMRAQSQDDWNNAKNLLDSAVSVGVPYYALGVKLLAEAFTLTESRAEHQGSDAQKVRAVAAKTIASEAFTTVHA